MNNLRFVSQKLPTECGVACIAMLGNTSLSEARSAVNFVNTSNSRTTQKELRAALKKSRKTLSKKITFTDKERLKSVSAVVLVAVNFKEKNGTQYWHWLVYDNTENLGRILDPSKPKERRSWGNTKPAWFHYVYDILVDG
ncbi:hypothetical protein LG202_01190 [Methylobacillus methanolivorans]